MDDIMEDEELMFDSTSISKVVNESITNIIGVKVFSQKESQEWMNKVVESVLTQLQTLQKPFKFCKYCKIRTFTISHMRNI